MARGNQMFAGLVAGVAVGAVAGLLFAPKSGKQSRQIVTTRADEIRHKAGDYADRVRAWRKSKEDARILA